MAEDWAADVRKYAPDADEGAVQGIIRHCGIALRTRDASLISFSDPEELARVRESFLRRKLGLTEPNAVLDAAIAEVGARMAGDPTKNRVTVYYLLAERFGKLALFTASAAAARGDPDAAAEAAASAAEPAAGPAPASAEPGAFPGAGAVPSPGETAELALAPAPQPASAGEPPAPTFASLAVASAAGSAPAAAGAGAAAAAAAVAARPARARDDDEGDGVIGTAAATLGVLGLGILGAIVAGTLVGGREGRPPEPLTAPVAAPVPAPAPAVPEGAGVVAEEVDGRPKVSVYFETAKFDIAPDFPTVAAPVKAYVDANPAARLAVSGFNDPRGDPVFNAELAKNRAEAVKAALVAIGVPEAVIDLEKPLETTDRTVSLAEARRVDIVVKDGGS